MFVSFQQTATPPSGSKLEELIKAVYEDENIAETYPLAKMYPFLMMLFCDGNKPDPEALLAFLGPEMQKSHKDMPNQMFLYIVASALVKIEVLAREVSHSAYMVCCEGMGGPGTLSSYLRTRLGAISEQLYLNDGDAASDLARSAKRHEGCNGQRAVAVYLKKIERKVEGYVISDLPIPQDT